MVLAAAVPIVVDHVAVRKDGVGGGAKHILDGVEIGCPTLSVAFVVANVYIGHDHESGYGSFAVPDEVALAGDSSGLAALEGSGREIHVFRDLDRLAGKSGGWPS